MLGGIEVSWSKLDIYLFFSPHLILPSSSLLDQQSSIQLIKTQSNLHLPTIFNPTSNHSQSIKKINTNTPHANSSILNAPPHSQEAGNLFVILGCE